MAQTCLKGFNFSHMKRRDDLKGGGLHNIGLYLFTGLKLCTVGVHSTLSSGLVGAGYIQ